MCGRILSHVTPPHINMLRINVRARVYIALYKKVVLIIVKMNVILKYCRIFALHNRKYK